MCCYIAVTGQLNLFKVVGAQLTNKTHFYCEKLNSYEHLQIYGGKCSQYPSGSAVYVLCCSRLKEEQ